MSENEIAAIRNLHVPTILLAGNAELNDPLVRDEKWDVLLKRPVSIGKIADTTQRIADIEKMRIKARE
jgi:hypothetical protein